VLGPGEHQLEVVYRHEGPGRGRGGELRLVVDGEEADRGRISATPPAVFSIDETFDVGLTTGSPAGAHPAAYPLAGVTLGRLDVELDG